MWVELIKGEKMASNKNLFLDNEYAIMTEIIENENITQRELSKRLDVSVSTVNVLINKMIKEGLIKMTHVSQKQVLYMLTPVGMMEKAKKTVRYLKAHYRTIYETKERIKKIIKELVHDYDVVYILMSNDEMGEIIKIATEEIDIEGIHPNLKIVSSVNDVNVKLTTALVCMNSYDNFYEELEDTLTVINITEQLSL